MKILIIIALSVALIGALATEDMRLQNRVIGVTALCKYGNFTTAARGQQGVCSGHGGVKKWLN